MNNSRTRSLLNKFFAVFTTTLLTIAGLAMVSAPAKALSTASDTITFSSPSDKTWFKDGVIVPYGTAGSNLGAFCGAEWGTFNTDSDGGVANRGGIVANLDNVGTGFFNNAFTIWKPISAYSFAGVTIKQFSSTGNTKFLTSSNKIISMKVKSPVSGQEWKVELVTSDGTATGVTASSSGTGWETLSFNFASTYSASAKYVKLNVIPDPNLTTAGASGPSWNQSCGNWVGITKANSTQQYEIDDLSYATTTTDPSPCTTTVNTCSSRIDWSGSTGVIQGYHNTQAETDISVKNAYYAQGVGYYQAYVKAGTTFKLKFLVKDKAGNPRPNLAVSLRANKAYSGSTAHWTIGGVAVNPAGDLNGGSFDGFTDSNGYVEYTITNTDTNPQPIGDPTKDDTDLSSFGSFALLQDSADTTEAMDIIEIHAYGLGFKIGNNSSYNAGTANGYLAADGSAVIQVPLIKYNSSFAYTVSSSKGDAYLAGPMIVVTGAKDGEAVTITLKMSDGTETATKVFGAKFTSTLSMKSPASISYDPVKKTVTCNNATYTKDPTDTAYYLYVNRVLKGGKKFGTTTGLQWMHRGVNLSTEGVTSTSATWSVPASWNNSNIARVYCETQAFGGNDEVRSLSSGFTIPRIGKYVPRSSTPAKLNPSAVTMRLVQPALTKDASGKAVNYYDWTWNALEYNWAQYYGKNLAFIYKYMNVGETTTLKWKVTDTDSGSVLDNFPVSLIINKNYGGMQNATFSYVVSGEKKVAAASPANNGTGETVVAGMTDDEGYVTFVITNTNTAAQAEGKPTAINAMQPAGGTDLHTQITLTAGLAQTKESIDLVEFHIVKP